MTWSGDMAASDALVAAYFDDIEFTAIGMAKPARGVNASTALDPERASFTFMGSIDSEPTFNQIGTAARTSASSHADRQVSRTCLSASIVGWPWMLKQGDQVEGGGQRYQLAAAPDRDGSERAVFWLNKV